MSEGKDGGDLGRKKSRVALQEPADEERDMNTYQGPDLLGGIAL